MDNNQVNSDSDSKSKETFKLTDEHKQFRSLYLRFAAQRILNDNNGDYYDSKYYADDEKVEDDLEYDSDMVQKSDSVIGSDVDLISDGAYDDAYDSDDYKLPYISGQTLEERDRREARERKRKWEILDSNEQIARIHSIKNQVREYMLKMKNSNSINK
jgi:hypothetical protein